MLKCTLLKKARKPIAKNCKSVFPKAVNNKNNYNKNNCNGSRHNSMTKKCRALLKCENERKSVEIIDLQLCSSLK